ncbi:sialate O-acetylesterase [Melioribacter sp. Ez-97]|uniref:sialate O-acetylesterase n=1 Tax=Melioribacter sp. Ez-97 TaxID=3423434 RepID=UPI003ED92332
MRILMFFLFASLLFAENGKGLKMPSIFSDNMVLQQNSKVAVWGLSNPGAEITVKASWNESAKATADQNGKWIAHLKTPSAGGPYLLSVTDGKSEMEFKNVLIGEVWLCSGQSNMEMPLEGWPPTDTVAHSKEVIANATNKNIRFFTVTRAISEKPEFDCVGHWEESNPESAAKFSATAYFFGKKLYEELNVPVGLIHSSWGGTPVEAWTGAKYISTVDEYKDIVEKLKDARKEIDRLKAWLAEKPTVDINSIKSPTPWKGLDLNDSECAKPDFDDSAWKTMDLPVKWESTEIGNFDGVVWFRKNATIKDEWVNKELILELGPIDDMDVTYVNGVKLGGYEEGGYWQTDRIYRIPAELVKDKNIMIAVRVIDTQGGGGIWGSSEKMKIRPADSNESISLAGAWKYLPVAEYYGGKLYLFDVKNAEYYKRPKLSVEYSSFTPTLLFNGMIAPLIPYGIKGAIWYQGESNAGNPELYKTLFPLMIKNWREEWGLGDFPFYYVQIAPYNYGPNVESQKLREAQLMTLSVPNTGMAVTLDIGNPNNIHPANKKDVGERLARWALAKNYGKKIEFSGPIYKSMKIEGNKIILTFDYTDGGLVIKEINGENNFLIAGKDKVFKKAKVEIKDDKLIVYSDSVEKPAAVRYCWDNISEGTLFNKAGLPASSFRTDNWD